MSLETTLDAWFLETVQRHGSNLALEVAGGRYTYDELAAAVDVVIDSILDTAGSAPRAVALLCQRSLAGYAGYLAALRLGAAVVPLNVRTPCSRNLAMCVAADVDIVIVDAAGASYGDSGFEQIAVPAVRVDAAGWWRRRSAAIERGAGRIVTAEDVAYVLFTSGSTGIPKGVPVRHRNLLDYVPSCVERYEVGPGARLSQTFELTFDPSVFDMFVAWQSGATLVVPTADEVIAPAAFVAERRITHWFSVPSAISVARRLRGLRPGCMPTLRWSLFAGEQLRLDQARTWAEASPNSVIENLYGPTEVTITCTAHRLSRDTVGWPQTSNGTVPIGRPLPHLEAVLIGQTEEDGVGELCIRGSQRFDGYLDPADDAGRFVRIDELGSRDVAGRPGADDWYRTGDRVRWEGNDLVHLGRVDHQLKIDGYRLEPTEVESVLRDHPAVSDAVVFAAERGSHAELHAAYTGDRVSDRALLHHLRTRLPTYMVPVRFVLLEQLPLSGNGKIDRQRARDICHGA